jgi:hypothetical protein
MRGLLMLSLLLVLVSCATGPGEKRRDHEEFTVRMIGSSIIPIPSAVAFGLRQGRSDTWEMEFGMDLIGYARFFSIYDKHFWFSDFYTTQGISAASSLDGGHGHGGLHFSVGNEFYSKGRLFTGIEYLAIDGVPFARVDTHGSILRIYWGWGF